MPLHTDMFVPLFAFLPLLPLDMSYYLPTSKRSTCCISYVHGSVTSFDGITLWLLFTEGLFSFTDHAIQAYSQALTPPPHGS